MLQTPLQAEIENVTQQVSVSTAACLKLGSDYSELHGQLNYLISLIHQQLNQNISALHEEIHTWNSAWDSQQHGLTYPALEEQIQHLNDRFQDLNYSVDTFYQQASSNYSTLEDEIQHLDDSSSRAQHQLSLKLDESIL